MALTLEQLEARLIAWTTANPLVRAVILVGSRARRFPPADAWSDLDTEWYVTDADALIVDDAWLTAFGEVWVNIPFDRDDGVPEWLILYEGALKLDISFHPLSDLGDLRANPQHSVFARGYRVLVDKDDHAATFTLPTYAAVPFVRPTEADFVQTVNLFWYGATYVAKQILRNELWVAWYRDGTLKESLLRMIEWHAHAHASVAVDTWHMGRFMQRWCDPAIWAELQGCFAPFTAPDQAAALRASMALFRRVAMETAAQWGYAYPALLDAQVSGFIAGLDFPAAE